MAGLDDHVTAVLGVPVTLALNCWVWEAVRAAESGVNEMVLDDVDTAGSARATTQHHTPIPVRNVVLRELGGLAVILGSKDPC